MSSLSKIKILREKKRRDNIKECLINLKELFPNFEKLSTYKLLNQGIILYRIYYFIVIYTRILYLQFSINFL